MFAPRPPRTTPQMVETFIAARGDALVTEAARSHVCQRRAIPFVEKGVRDDTSTLWGVNQTELGMEHQVVVVGQPIC
jgi:hypothetical protein